MVGESLELEPVTRPKPLGVPAALLVAMRPKQWSKNLFIFVAALFTANIPTSFAQTQKLVNFGIACLAFLLFCLISSAVYLMNDIVDREQDRLHPEKRNRPIANGSLPVAVAGVASAIFGIGGVSASFLINFKFGAAALVYYVLQFAYTWWLKHQVLLDVFAIAAGFVLRAVAGALAIQATISVWLLVCTLQLALFLGFGKRRHELVSLAEGARDHRRILEHYTVSFLDQLIAISLAGLTVRYSMYSITSPTALLHPALVMTLPNVFYGIFRYLYLIHVQHKGGSPESILLEDRPMQINLIMWFLEVAVAFKVQY
jgi:4-hydroxybenzoate polyprenyltransferase